jgi:hypothetical protein
MDKEPITTDADAQAANIINEHVEGASSASDLQRKIEQDTRAITDETRTKINTYVSGMKDATKGAVIDELDAGVGGLYNGKEQIIAESTLEVSGSIEQTVNRIGEVSRHEAYHATNKHLESMQTAAGQGSEETLVLGGKSFKNDTPLVEGLTVHDTGNEFVSDQYVQYEEELVSAASAAGVSMDEVRNAVNVEKDLTLIDDRTREDAAEPQYAMAA